MVRKLGLFSLLLLPLTGAAQVRPPTWSPTYEPAPPPGCRWLGADKILLCPGTFNATRPPYCPTGYGFCRGIWTEQARKLCRGNLGGFFAADVNLAPSATGGPDEAVCAVPGSGVVAGFAGCGTPSRGKAVELTPSCNGFTMGILCDPAATYPTGWECEEYPINQNPSDGVMCCPL